MGPLIWEAIATIATAVWNMFDPDDDEEQRREYEKQLEHELEEQRREYEKQLEEQRREHEKQVIAIGVVCLILASLVTGSVTWYVLQPSQPSEQIISLEELEKYEKARDAGLQALEDYVINNPNSPYISQAKDQIRAYQR